MSELINPNPPANNKRIRMILLLLGLITFPLFCCGVSTTLYLIPGVGLSFFRIDFQVENNTVQTLYLTPITTTRGYPQVIGQLSRMQQTNIPLQAGESISLTYDGADMPLSGIVVCNTNDECRLLDRDGGREDMVINSFAALSAVNSDWVLAVQEKPEYNFRFIIFPLLGLLPIAFLGRWVYLTWEDKKGNSGIGE